MKKILQVEIPVNGFFNRQGIYNYYGGATMLLDIESELVYHHDQELMSLLVPDSICLLKRRNVVVTA